MTKREEIGDETKGGRTLGHSARGIPPTRNVAGDITPLTSDDAELVAES